jgi:hypothetical protein
MSPLNPQAGHAFLRDTIKRYAMHNAFTMTRVCTMARAGWDEAEIALRELIGEIMNRGDQLPTVLGAFAIELLDPRRPHHFSGPKKAGRFLQDICITVIVSRVAERHRLKPTRRPSQSTKPSACSIVARALEQAGVHRNGERAVEKIWERYHDI